MKKKNSLIFTNFLDLDFKQFLQINSNLKSYNRRIINYTENSTCFKLNDLSEVLKNL